MIFDVEDYLAHIGVLRRSGRYPWGSGANPHQHNKNLLVYISDLKSKGLSDKEIYEGLELTSTEYRAIKSMAKNEQKAAKIAQAVRLKDAGMGNVAIGKEMGLRESSVRDLLSAAAKDKGNVLESIANQLQENVDAQQSKDGFGFLDVGAGNELYLGVSSTRLGIALAMLREKGYEVHNVQYPQLGTNHKTTTKVLAPPGTTYRDIVSNIDNVQSLTGYSDDGGRSFLGVYPPKSFDSKRLAVRYAEEGGADADGVMYVRPGVKDISLGGNQYAQVRVNVNNTHFLKGMAIYKDDLPDGVDIMFNTNKSDTGNKLDALKPLKTVSKDDPTIDWDNPFGAVIDRQITSVLPDGKRQVDSVMNLLNEQGKWDDWSRNLSSQMLSKQKPALAKTQLGKTFADKKAEYDEIMSLTNPTVKKKLLESFSDDVDASAVHLKAAAINGQSTKVILPVNAMKDTEVYAPTLRDGERVALVRFPHGGVFEIPELTVNNRVPAAKKLLGNAPDAIGINSTVAKRLSGADFDGDTVLVIPNSSGAIKTKPPLQQLQDFDPQNAYPAYEGMPKMSARTKGIQMGDVSNLITDMTIKGANDAEIARAVKHSMVVIDAEKHNLNYRQSAKDQGIAALKAKYQGGGVNPRAGASTLISRKKQEYDVPERSNTFKIDPATGKKVYKETGGFYVNRKGERVDLTTKVKKIDYVDDVNDLTSGTPMEKVYADHSNRLKALANDARKSMVTTPNMVKDDAAAKMYKAEVDKLNADLNIALKNRPRERNALLIANTRVDARKRANPDMDPSELKKIKGQALAEARVRAGAKKVPVEISAKQWEAIQAGAISNHKLAQILDNADLDAVKKLATPKAQQLMTSGNSARAQALLSSGKTQAEVAQILGVSLTTLKTSLAEGKG